eukprot:gene7124-9722_t
MMQKLIVVLALIASVMGFAPMSRFTSRTSSLNMVSMNEIQQKFGKALGIAAMGVVLAGPAIPMAAMADGAVSASTVYRARNSYGNRILGLESAANSGNFAAFEDKKAINGFDLFISASNALNSKTDKERKAAEKSIQANLYAAVKAKDSGKLKSAYADFIKVADLKSAYKPGELGQTDSSGYSPTWGTDKQYIYQR